MRLRDNFNVLGKEKVQNFVSSNKKGNYKKSVKMVTKVLSIYPGK